MLDKGLIQLYTSESILMNYAPFGLALRAAGQNFRTFIVNFIPDDLMEGARVACEILKPHLVIEQLGDDQTLHNVSRRRDSTPRGTFEIFRRIREAAFSREFDIVVINGIDRAIDQGLISLNDIMTLMEEKPFSVELVLSGLRTSEQIVEKADLVTEMVVHKHQPPLYIGNCPDGSGTVEIVTGNGKGKTTYCLGKAMLTSCIGISTLILQFIKSPKLYGEIKAIERLPNLDIKTMGKGFLIKHTPYLDLDKKHKQVAQQAWKLWLNLLNFQDYGLLVMDEINIATSYGLINGDRIREMLFLRPQKFNSLLSGRNAHPEVIKASATYIEMKEIKHPFKIGIVARRGIEF